MQNTVSEVLKRGIFSFLHFVLQDNWVASLLTSTLYKHWIWSAQFHYIQSWAPATWKVASLPLFGEKNSGTAVCRYINKKLAPLPLLAHKTTAAAATLEKYLAKKNNGIWIGYPIVNFQLYLRKLQFKLFKYWYRLQSASAGLNDKQVSKSQFN